MDKQISSRLDIVRFPLIVAVVFIHHGDAQARAVEAAHGDPRVGLAAHFAVSLIGNGMARAAVPLFFLMSAYLFFYCDSLSAGEYARKLKSRVRTLLVPFLFWNLAVLLAIAIAQSIPAIRGWFPAAYPIIRYFKPYDYFNAVMGITGSPAAFQFWFIRDLMVLVVLSPAIGYLVRSKLCLLFVAGVFALWCMDQWPFAWPSVEATLFFSLGTYLALKDSDLRALDGRGGLLLSLFIPVLLAYSVLATIGSSESGLLVKYFQKAVILLGAAVAWWLTGRLIVWSRLKGWLIALGGSSFFVFAAHEPLMMVVRKLVFSFAKPQSEAAVIGLYLSIPIFLIAFLVAVYGVLKVTVPRFLAVVTGGRGQAQHRYVAG